MKAILGAALGDFVHHQKPRSQFGQDVANSTGGNLAMSTYFPNGVGAEGTGKDRHSPQEQPLRFGEQVVAPCQCRSKRLVAPRYAG